MRRTRIGDWRKLITILRSAAEQIPDASDRHDYGGEQGERSKHEYHREDQCRNYANQQCQHARLLLAIVDVFVRSAAGEPVLRVRVLESFMCVFASPHDPSCLMRRIRQAPELRQVLSPPLIDV